MKNWQEMIKTKNISTLGPLNVNSKTIILLAGPSLAGKTVTCLHLMDDAIKKNHKSMYIDTEEKSVLLRPSPNLFKTFYEKNKKSYDSNFIYFDNIKTKDIINEIEKNKPKIIFIDSLYKLFLNEYGITKVRTMEIKNFLISLRSYIYENEMGCVITTPTGRIVDPTTKKDKNVPLGGEWMKYLSDVKVLIQFIGKDDKDSETPDKRLFIVDRQYKHAFKIEYGGKLIPISNHLFKK